MAYSEIIDAAKATGVHEFDQGQAAAATHINIGNGVCRALSIDWLRAKKAGTDFWKGRGTVKEGLLDEDRRIAGSVELQDEYRAALTSRFVPDATTVRELRAAGLSYNQGEVRASTQQGFAEREQPLSIATQVLSAKSRFSILSIAGTSGGHSIGIFRPYALIGKSSDAHVFDPNFGEIKTSTTARLRQLIAAIDTNGYVPYGMDLNKSYILWTFND